MLLRGVNKQIIEINETDDIYFEKAVLYVRPEYVDEKAQKLSENAHEFLKKLDMSENDALPWENHINSKNAKNRFVGKKLLIGSIALSGAIVTAVAAVLLYIL